MKKERIVVVLIAVIAVFVTLASIALFFCISHYEHSAELKRNVFPSSPQLNIKPQFSDQELPYDPNTWKLERYFAIDSIRKQYAPEEGEYDAEPAKAYVLRSVKATAQSAFDRPLYDLNVIIVKDGRVIYQFASGTPVVHSSDDTLFRNYYVDQGFEHSEMIVTDVIGTTEIHSPYEITFWSNGYQATSGGASYLHILKYDENKHDFEDVSNSDFSSYVYSSDLGWVDGKDGKNYLLVVHADPSDERACHSCASHFLYEMYNWDELSGKFILAKTITSERKFSEAPSALLDARYLLSAQN